MISISEFRTMLKFSPDTAYPGSSMQTPSSGHCAVVSYLVHLEFGFDMVSAMVSHDGGQVSHWFNRNKGAWLFDVDLTSDQFGKEKVLYSTKEELYPNSKIRKVEDLSEETKQRAKLLAQRSNLGYLFE